MKRLKKIFKIFSSKNPKINNYDNAKIPTCAGSRFQTQHTK